jgi:hypothetical protein
VTVVNENVTTEAIIPYLTELGGSLHGETGVTGGDGWVAPVNTVMLEAGVVPEFLRMTHSRNPTMVPWLSKLNRYPGESTKT